MKWKKIIKKTLPSIGGLNPRQFIKLINARLTQVAPHALMVRFDDSKDSRPNVVLAHKHGFTAQDFINEINKYPEYKIRQTSNDTVWVETNK